MKQFFYFSKIKVLGGIELEQDYPYEARDDQCQYDPNKFQAKVDEVIAVGKNEVAIQEALVKYGPVSIC